MSEAKSVPRPSRVELRNRYWAAFLAWMVPGLGHWYQGRRVKGVLYGVCILALFFVGLYLQQGRDVFFRWTSPSTDSENFRFSYLCQFFNGLVALPGLIQAVLKHNGVAPILWGYLAEPSLIELRGVYPRLGAQVEVGWVYTVIAGLLNVLAILDAFDGPAQDDDRPTVASKSLSQAVS